MGSVCESLRLKGFRGSFGLGANEGVGSQLPRLRQEFLPVSPVSWQLSRLAMLVILVTRQGGEAATASI